MAINRTRAVRAGDVVAAMEQIAPLSLAQSWDNVGLIAGDRNTRCRHVLLCIDLTPPVLDEAVARGCDFVLAYHPPIFRAIQKIVAQSTETDALIFRAIAAGLAVYSPHTALDAAQGGTNDVIAAMCGLTELQPFEYVSTGESQSKLVTFVPEVHLEKVASEMFAAGAGRIGEYEQCSYRVHGEGTFFGGDKTNPRVGRRGQLERVAETRLEVAVPNRRLPEIIAALRQSHPYEEPAFDVYPLTAELVAGIGRIGQLPARTTLRSLAERLRRTTRSQVLMTVGAVNVKVRYAAVCVGAAGRLPFEKPRSAECDVIVTGEIRHHDALSILRRKRTAIALGHWESERPVLAPLAKRLAGMLREVTVTVSSQDVAPFGRL